jgi:hypothetical protein
VTAALGPWTTDRRRGEPLVLAVCRTPLLCEAVAPALEGAAIVRGFPAGSSDTAGLMARVEPDAVLVDAQDEADGLERHARESNTPLVHVLLESQQIRALRNGSWSDYDNPENSVTEIRNVLIGELFATAARRLARIGTQG